MKKKRKRTKIKILPIIVVLAFSCLIFPSASFIRDGLIAVTANADTVQNMPTTTSAELGVYLDDGVVRHSDGTTAKEYSVNSDGHIVDADGNVVVAAGNAQIFTCIGSIKYNQADTELTLPTYLEENRTICVAPLAFTFEFEMSPDDAINREINIESNDPGALYIPYDANKDLLEGVEAPNSNAMPSATFTAKEGKITLTLTGCFEGEYTLTFRNVRDEVVDRVTFKLSAEDIEIPATGDPATAQNAGPHEHEYHDTVIEPTYRTRGYTLHVCGICGYTIRDTYTDQLVCTTHDYESRVIEPTYTSGGYTIYTCKNCGDTKRGNETPTLTCTHKWDSGVTTVSATCSKEGKIVYHCTICGKTKEETVPKTAHNMTSAIVAPTQASEGYTRHYCTVCGYETAHTDVVPALPHEHSYTKSVTQPTCTTDGYTTYTCTSCGSSYTGDTVPALGHSYSVSTVAATCETGGYTLHTCSRCGASYKDNETAALGHDWEEHTEHIKTGQEVHWFCDACGMDFSLAGMDGAAMSAHTKTHVLNGESGRTYTAPVDVYSDVITYKCKRCGAIR